MKSIFGKYLFLCFIGIIIEVIVLIVVLIQTFRLTNDLAVSIFDFINNQAIILDVFNFIVNWAVTLSFIAVGLILVAFFINFKKYRRNRALNRVHDWAKNAILLLADYRQRDSGLQDSPLARNEGTRVLTDALKAHGRTILANAHSLGGELDTKTKKAVHTLFDIDEKLEKNDESAYEDLRTLQHDLADVMMATFEYLQNS